MHRAKVSSMILIAAALFCGPAEASTYRLGRLEVAQPWSRPAVAGTNGIGYMTLSNHGKSADALIGVDSPLAARIEMHSSRMAGGVMSMRREDRIVLPPGGRADFGPGGYHLMLIGLTKTMKVGEEIPATLNFASGRHLKVEFAVEVEPAAGTTTKGSMDGMAGMGH